MLLKFSEQLSILALAVSLVPFGFAQTSTGKVPSKAASSIHAASGESGPARSGLPPVWVGPALHAPGGRLSGGTANSYNWSGYVVTGSDFTSATGSWNVPATTCSKSPNSLSFFWVGIDGWTDNTVEQIGTAAFCNKTTVTYYAWYEFYPSASVEITTLTLKAGDHISAQVSYSGSEFTLKITDETSGKSFSVSQSVSGAGRSSAEWIAEAPTVVTGISNLADFTKAAFGDDHTGIAGTNYATDSAHSGPISAFGSSAIEITQVDFLNYAEATPSALSSDGTSFTSTWVEPN